ncbi:low molecular weight phosphatase family protein [Aureimonas sp. AU4]|uniref:arsenate-mycothiol transferase ArsC n=1 Tax=Aureimonas sp. AU4 TaxID=1638163 RepID=UPI000782A26C|nr:low molecular weight phosphatase family protein [Aureimonas sp. AU4]
MSGTPAGGAPGSILFVCGQNSIRSPMAEAIARAVLPGTYVASAGVKGGERDPFVDVVLAEEGLTLGDRRPQTVEDLADGYFDLVVTLSPEAHHAVMDATGADATAVEFWPMPDPSAVNGSRDQILDAYRDLYRRMRRRLTEFGERRRPPV